MFFFQNQIIFLLFSNAILKCYSRDGSYCKIRAHEQSRSFFRNQSSCLGAEKPDFAFSVMVWKTLYLKKIADRPTNTANSWVACPWQFQAYYSITHYRHKIWKKYCEFLGCDCRKATNGPSKDNGDGSFARLLMIFTNAWFLQNLEGGYKPSFTGHTICLNKAGYTATEVVCGWPGAIFEVTRPFGQELWGQRNKKS